MTHYKVKLFKLRNEPKVQWADYYEDGSYFEDRFILVPVDQIHFNKWNQGRYEFYMEAFKAGRPADPVRLARPWNGGNHYEVSDGNHRIAASIDSGYTHIPAIVSVKIEGKPPKGSPPKDLYEEVHGRELLMVVEYFRARCCDAGLGARIYFEWGGIDASGYWMKVSDESKSTFDPYESRLTIRIQGDIRKADMSWQGGRFSYHGDLEGMKRAFLSFMESNGRVSKVAMMIASNLADLQGKYRFWNNKVWGGTLPPVAMKWIKSIRRGGTTKGTRVGTVYTPESIEISSYLATDEEKLDGILLHEMVHVQTMVKDGMDFGGSHGVFFRANLRDAESKAGRKIPLSEDLSG